MSESKTAAIFDNFYPCLCNEKTDMIGGLSSVMESVEGDGVEKSAGELCAGHLEFGGLYRQIYMIVDGMEAQNGLPEADLEL